MMKFDFLPELPNSNLDDRAFDDLVEECLLRIPRYCPEWTDHNLSDPGITLVELFAWLADQVLRRLNQVPRKNYVAFLELLGIRLQPPTSAQTSLTFYLTTDVSESFTILRNTEVTTERTADEEAIVFSTQTDLVIGEPRLRHFLSAPSAEDIPQVLYDRTDQWHQETSSSWTSNELMLFSEQPQPGNCFYLVMEPEAPLEGSVMRLNFKGAKGAPTGIDPKHPPRRWEAWDGDQWQPILLRESDDATCGFSFEDISQNARGATEQSANVILHLPEFWPVFSFMAYQGRWLRCVLTTPDVHQASYINSPRIIEISAYAIGGTVRASQSILVEYEELGISNGKPGQNFQVVSPPILERRQGEYVYVTPIGELPQIWQEVLDFADSGSEDLHYTVDSQTGTIQFGSLIREPGSLRLQTQARTATQRFLPKEHYAPMALKRHSLEHQYGAVPPRGARITLAAYRTGGGSKGNVQAGTLRFPSTSIPYVASVTNHVSAVNGADAESLDQAVLRVPQILRSCERAVTAEDFEILALQSGAGVARALCLPTTSATQNAGSVGLLIVPQVSNDAVGQSSGISPQELVLTSALRDRVSFYLDERRLLGVQVHLQSPTYVGVSVQAEVALQPAYNHPTAQREILHELREAFYQYLNPLTGGPDGIGWPFGRPLYPNDIVALIQQYSQVQYLGAVLLFAIFRQGETWQRQPIPEPLIDPGANGLICSWADEHLRTSHVVNCIQL
jgi:predicted phage baseplate assembly protein